MINISLGNAQGDTLVDGNVVFTATILDEVLDLLLESHDYFERYAPAEEPDMPKEYRMMYSAEMSRITMRMTSIMAWLMVRKAVFAGQISFEEAAEKYRLEGKEIGLVVQHKAMEFLPAYMTYLLDRTHDLYQRVSRLDDLAYSDDEPMLFDWPEEQPEIH